MSETSSTGSLLEGDGAPSFLVYVRPSASMAKLRCAWYRPSLMCWMNRRELKVAVSNRLDIVSRTWKNGTPPETVRRAFQAAGPDVVSRATSDISPDPTCRRLNDTAYSRCSPTPNAGIALWGDVRTPRPTAADVTATTAIPRVTLLIDARFLESSSAAFGPGRR